MQGFFWQKNIENVSNGESETFSYLMKNKSSSLTLMKATCLKKVETGATKGWKSKWYKKETTGGTCCKHLG